ncbi:flavoprotein [Streptomyces gardneri]|nr:flavoprotein [Streptomyces gardneri]
MLEDYRQGINLPDGIVMATNLVATVDDQIVGRTSIRHTLNDALLRRGGALGIRTARNRGPPAPADAIIAAPLTTNSMAKRSTGIGDTLPLALLVEAVSEGLPVVAIPHDKQEQVNFPAVREARERLAGWGVWFVRITEDGETGPLPWTRTLNVLGEPLAAAGSATVCQNR